MNEAAATVLIVDDEPAVGEALRRTLQRDGHRLVLLNDPKAALAHLSREPVDILISDLEMPEMNGLELVAEVRKRWPDVIRVILTGGASLESALQAINQGEVHRYLTKPWDNDELRETIRSALARLRELRGAARAEVRARAQATLREDLEAQYPGITDISRAGPAYVLDDLRVGNVLRAMDSSARSRFQAAASNTLDDITRPTPYAAGISEASRD